MSEKPQFYSSEVPEGIRAACTRGDHAWTTAPQDACIYCILDLYEGLPAEKVRQLEGVFDRIHRDRVAHNIATYHSMK